MRVLIISVLSLSFLFGGAIAGNALAEERCDAPTSAEFAPVPTQSFSN